MSRQGQHRDPSFEYPGDTRAGARGAAMAERLAVRNLFTDLREQGQVSGGQGA